MTPDEIFAQLAVRVAAHPELVALNGTYQFNISSDDASDVVVWALDLTEKGAARPRVWKGKIDKPDVEITLSQADLAAIQAGTLDPQMAFYEGRLRVAGKASLAITLKTLFTG